MDAWLKKHRQALHYIFWCIMTTAVSWLTYSLYIGLLQFIPTLTTEVAVLIANALSWVSAVTFSFVANKMLVFQSKSWKPQVVLPQIIKFFSTRAIIGLLEIVLVPILVSIGLNQTVWGVEGLLAKMIVTPIVILLNYICSKFFVFAQKKNSKNAE